MANTIITPTIYTQETLDVLENFLVFTKGVNRNYDDRFANAGAKIGDTINVRRPARYVGVTGAALSTEDHTETSLPLQLDTQFHVDTTFTTSDLTLKLDEFSDRLIKPVSATIANKIDADGLLMAKNNTGNQVGSAGTVPATALVLLQAAQKLDELGTPRDGDRRCVINPAANATLINAMTGFFNSVQRISAQFEDGQFVDARGTLGMLIAMSQNIPVHTVGALSGGAGRYTLSGSVTYATGWSQTSSIITNNWTASQTGVVTVGDVFTIANVYAVNPQTRASTGALMQFVVRSGTLNSDSSGNMTLVCQPAIITAGQFQNVSVAPSNNAALVFTGTAATGYAQNLLYHKNAFVLGTADLQDVSQFGAWGARKNYKGISMRAARQYAIATDTVPCRVDVLYGWRPLYADAMAVRITA